MTLPHVLRRARAGLGDGRRDDRASSSSRQLGGQVGLDDSAPRPPRPSASSARPPSRNGAAASCRRLRSRRSTASSSPSPSLASFCSSESTRRSAPTRSLSPGLHGRGEVGLDPVGRPSSLTMIGGRPAGDRPSAACCSPRVWASVGRDRLELRVAELTRAIRRSCRRLPLVTWRRSGRFVRLEIVEVRDRTRPASRSAAGESVSARRTAIARVEARPCRRADAVVVVARTSRAGRRRGDGAVVVVASVVDRLESSRRGRGRGRLRRH